MPKPSPNLAKIPPYLFTALNIKAEEARKKGVDVINLGIGDPDLGTPPMIVKALQDAVADPVTHNYPGTKGTPDFRKAASEWMKTRFGVTVDADKEVLNLIGSKEGLAHLIFAYVQPGDVVLCPSPGYPVYENFTILCGGTPYIVPMLPENNFLPDYTKIPADILAKAKILFLNYPNNPTGAIAPDKFIRETIELCRKHDILLCHDNAYSEMTFDGYRAPSFLQVDGAKDVCIEMFSLSKMYNMTGWRCGFAVGNEEALKALFVVKTNCDTGTFKPIQKAGALALSKSDEILAGLNDIYAKRRDIMVKGLQKLGWDYKGGAATFYLWVPVPTGWTSVDFVTLLLEKCGIVVPPGVGYGPAGEGFFRMALTVPEKRLHDVLERMEKNNVTWNALAKGKKTA